MTKRMLIDDTHPEETRVVVVNGNKVEDVEFESSNRKQIKGNIYLAKVMRIEPSLQAAFVDYGGNKHGFLAFGEIHPDYYNISDEEMAEVDKEVDAIIEAKKQALKEREEQRAQVLFAFRYAHGACRRGFPGAVRRRDRLQWLRALGLNRYPVPPQPWRRCLGRKQHPRADSARDRAGRSEPRDREEDA